MDKVISVKASTTDYQLLCDSLNGCIATAVQEITYIDDTVAERKLYREFGRVDTMPRGYASIDESVGTIICRFLAGKAGLNF